MDNISTSPQSGIIEIKKEVFRMFLGLAWYWWLVIMITFLVTLPFKLKLLKKMSTKNQSLKDDKND